MSLESDKLNHLHLVIAIDNRNDQEWEGKQDRPDTADADIRGHATLLLIGLDWMSGQTRNNQIHSIFSPAE